MNLSKFISFSNFYILKDANASSAPSDRLTIYAEWYILPYMKSWNHCLLELLSSLVNTFKLQETKVMDL